MEKIMQFFNNDITQSELMSYFSTEIICLVGVLINLIMFLFFSRKYNIKRLSDLTTFIIFSVNSFISLAILIKNKLVFNQFSFTLFNDSVVFNNDNLYYKFLTYLFFALFVLCTYKLTRKARFRTTLVNPCLLLLAPIATLLIQVQNGIIAFILLDLCSLFIYKFASNMRIRKTNYYSLDFIFMSACSTILFFAFYGFSFLVKEELQSTIILVCMTCALLLKAGLFPVFNYTTNRNTKNNLAYSMLLFGFLPFMGVIAFAKFIQTINISNEIYSIVITTFISILILMSSIYAFRTKNIVRYIANYVYINCSLFVFSIIFAQDRTFCLNSAYLCLFMIFALYSALAILKLNLKPNKININLLKGLFVKNRFYTAFLSVVILCAINVIPSVCTMNAVEILKGVYEFNKFGSAIVLLFVLSNILILLNALKIIQAMYSRETNINALKITKRTMLNYIVPCLIILLLTIMIFL